MQNHAKNEAPEEEAGTRQGKNENVYVSNAWFNLTCYHPPPLSVQPPGTNLALWAWGWGIVWNGPVPGGRGWGKSKITSLPTSYFVKFMSFLAHFARWLPADLKTTHSQGKLQEFVRERLEWNNLSKFKPFLKVYFKFLLECAYNALIFFGKATKKYFFSLVLWYDKTT